jgi:hypothetical protein
MIKHTSEAPNAHTQLGRNLVAYTGRDPGLYKVLIDDDGCVRVLSPGAAVRYPADAWTSKFVRHLHGGLFDVVELATLCW